MIDILYWAAVAFGVAWLVLVVEAALSIKRRKPSLPAAPLDDEELARAVATALRLGLEVNNGWRDYGGHGLVHRDRMYIYGPSCDGVIQVPRGDGGPSGCEDRTFRSEDEFVAWLVLKMSEHGPCLLFHQCISRQRLESAASHGSAAAQKGERLSVRV